MNRDSVLQPTAGSYAVLSWCALQDRYNLKWFRGGLVVQDTTGAKREPGLCGILPQTEKASFC